MICGTSSFHGLNEFFYVMNMGGAKLIWLALPIYCYMFIPTDH